MSLTKVKGILKDLTPTITTSFPVEIPVSVKHPGTCKENSQWDVFRMLARWFEKSCCLMPKRLCAVKAKKE